MQNKIIGLIILMVSFFGSIFLMTPDVPHFLSLSSLGFVIAFGGGLSYMRKDKYNGNELLKIIKENLIVAGWMGVLLGSIVMLTGFGDGGTDALGMGLSAALISPLYGYILGYIIEAFFEK
jgi:flagellar motor component MotA